MHAKRECRCCCAVVNVLAVLASWPLSNIILSIENLYSLLYYTERHLEYLCSLLCPPCLCEISMQWFEGCRRSCRSGIKGVSSAVQITATSLNTSVAFAEAFNYAVPTMVPAESCFSENDSVRPRNMNRNND